MSKPFTRQDMDAIFNTVDRVSEGGRIIGNAIVDGFNNGDSRRNLGGDNLGYNNPNNGYSQIPNYGYGYADTSNVYNNQYGMFNLNPGMNEKFGGYPGFYDPAYGKGGQW